MSAVELTEAVEAAAEYQFGIEAARLGIDAAHVGQAWDDAEPIVKHAYRESVLGAVTAAAPVIEAQVRAQIAAEVKRELGGLAAEHLRAGTRISTAAAHTAETSARIVDRIARGEPS